MFGGKAEDAEENSWTGLATDLHSWSIESEERVPKSTSFILNWADEIARNTGEVPASAACWWKPFRSRFRN